MSICMARPLFTKGRGISMPSAAGPPDQAIDGIGGTEIGKPHFHGDRDRLIDVLKREVGLTNDAGDAVGHDTSLLARRVGQGDTERALVVPRHQVFDAGEGRDPLADLTRQMVGGGVPEPVAYIDESGDEEKNDRQVLAPGACRRRQAAFNLRARVEHRDMAPRHGDMATGHGHRPAEDDGSRSD